MSYQYLKSIVPAALFLMGTPTTEIVEYVHQRTEALAIELTEAEAKQEKLQNLHTTWDALLKKYVTSKGSVDYGGMSSDARLGEYLKDLSANYPQSSWTRNQKMAYWINAYNAFTVKLIVDNRPLKSIKDIGSPWDKNFIMLDGKAHSLNQIENKILRPQFGDARIHFAINCASVSCPPLSNKAFTEANVSSEMQKLTKAFINSSSYNTLGASAISISPLFDWYGVDFTKEGTVIDFLNRYAATAINADATIGYTDYDWNLNGK